MADPQDEQLNTGLPHPQSGDYAALAEMSYRRALDANPTHIDTVDGVTAINPLNVPVLQDAANDWREGADVATWIREEYGLTLDPIDRGDGLTHFYTQNGFSGYITTRDNSPSDPSDTQFIITFRGTDIADNAEGEMMDGITAAGTPLLAAAARGVVGVDWARDAHPSPENYRAAIEEATGQPFEDFTVKRNADGSVNERLVDAGDIYTNGLLGQGTYQETQYDDAKALYRLVNEHMASDGQDVVLAGQSLGGGLAALVALEHGAEAHTFGMAPFQNQFEIIAERNAVREMLLDPENADALGGIAEGYRTASVVRQNTIERETADQLEDLAEMNLRKGGHNGRNVNIRIAEFNETNGTHIDRDIIRTFNALRTTNAQDYENNKPDAGNPAHPSRFYASTVGEEFTTNAGEGSGLGVGVVAGSQQIIPTAELHRYDLGDNQTDDKIRHIRETVADGGKMFPTTGQSETVATRAMGEGLSTHSPALNDLVTNSQNSPVGSFDRLLEDSPNLRYSVLHRPGLMGAVASGKVGSDDDPSASQSIAPTNETAYRALSNSLRGDGELYAHTVETLRTINTQGRASEGADSDYPAEPTLNSAVNQFVLQELRDRTQGRAAGETLSGADVDFAGTLNGNGLVAINLERLEPEHDMNRLTDASGNPIEGLAGLQGYKDLQTVIYDTVREQVTLPNNQGFFEPDNHTTARVTDSILGTSLDFRNFNRTEGKLNIPEGELAIGQLYVQTGTDFGRNWDLTNQVANNVSGQLSTAVFLDEGNNKLLGSNRRDLAMLGGGNDEYVSQVEGGALISGNTGYDTYSVAENVGPISALLSENTLQVVQNTNLSQVVTDPRHAVDTAIGIEHFELSKANDTIQIVGLSGNRVLDGGGGLDSINYRELDSDFRFYAEDGVLNNGVTYNSRLSDGESTLYIIGIEDEAVTRSEMFPVQRGSVPTEKAIEILQEEQEAASPEVRPEVHEALNHPDAAQMFANLYEAKVETIPATLTAEMPRNDRIVELLQAGRVATQEAGLPMPEDTQQNDQVTDMQSVANEADSYEAAGLI